MSKGLIKLVSWNVNGLRAVLRKDALSPVLEINPDIICLQEAKLSKGVIPDMGWALEYPHQYFHYAEKNGYSGTTIVSKYKPISVQYDMEGTEFEHPEEGRVITLEFQDSYLVNVYTPNSKDGLLRLAYRQNEWDKDFRKYVSGLNEKKPVIVCGDLNVAHKEIDLARPKENRRSAGFTDEEREGLDLLLAEGFIDTFRELNPEVTDRYTWWSYRGGARGRNVGWRIDYFLIAETLKKQLSAAAIHDDIVGSDHCPVSIDIELDV